MRIKIIAVLSITVAAVLVAFIGNDIFDARLALAEPQKPNEAQAPKPAPPADVEKGLLAALAGKEKELALREEELVRKEERLNVIKTDIEQRIAELKKVHENIAQLVRKIDEINDERVKRIVKIYEAMNPEEAASRIEKLDQDMAVMILASMSERKAAKVLSFVDVAKSAKLSQSLRVKD